MSRDPFPHEEIAALAQKLWIHQCGRHPERHDPGPWHFWFRAEAELRFDCDHPHAAIVQEGGSSWFVRDEDTGESLSDFFGTQQEAWDDARDALSA